MSVGLDRSIGTHRTKMIGIWETFIDKLNKNNEKKLSYLKANDTALFDHAGFPQMESLTMGGNIITLDEIRDGWGRVHTLDAVRVSGSLSATANDRDCGCSLRNPNRSIKRQYPNRLKNIQGRHCQRN